MRQLIAIDIDGVVADIHNSLMHHFNVPDNQRHEYDLAPYGCTPKFFTSRTAFDIFQNAQLIPGARMGLDIISDHPELIPVYWTRRPVETYQLTTQWLEDKSLPLWPIMWGNKADYAKRHKIRLAIEDAPDDAFDLKLVGTSVFLIDHPYNRHLSSPRGGWEDTIKWISEFTRKVEAQ